MCLNFFIKHKITNLLELLFYCKEKFKQLRNKKTNFKWKIEYLLNNYVIKDGMSKQ